MKKHESGTAAHRPNRAQAATALFPGSSGAREISRGALRSRTRPATILTFGPPGLPDSATASSWSRHLCLGLLGSAADPTPRVDSATVPQALRGRACALSCPARSASGLRHKSEPASGHSASARWAGLDSAQGPLVPGAAVSLCLLLGCRLSPCATTPVYRRPCCALRPAASPLEFSAHPI